jgi:pimeloyl-ACP methyl ester carboxylesterase
VGLLALGVPAAATASDYCVPANSHYDPLDVPADGSQLRSAPGVTRSTVEVSGVRTPVLASGPQNSQEAVVFLHGSPGSSEDWLDLLPRIGALGRRALAWDMPGFGHADKPWDQKADLESGSRFIGDMLRRLGVTRVHFVLQDLGGAPALQWASEHPQALIGAVLIDTGLLGYRHHQFAQISRTPEGGEAFMLTLNRAIWRQGMQDGQQERPIPESFVDRLYDDLDRRTRCLILKVYRGAEEDQIERWGRAQANVLSQRRRPALILWGRHDPYLPPSMAERQREVFPGAPIHIFEQSGHWPFVDDPGRTASLVVPFVRCLPTGKRGRIRVSVAPRRLRSRRRVRLRFRATVRREGRSRPVCGATVRFARRKAMTDGDGTAQIKLASIRRGKHRVRVTKAGLRRGVATVRVAAPRHRSGWR